jgi:tetratricopeptide (TPR) repeat protein
MGRLSKILLATGAAAALATFGGLALGLSEQDLKDCQKGNPETSIRACTRIISDYLTGKAEIAVAHEHRAAAYTVRRDYSRAIADLNDALRLAPTSQHLIVVRASAHAAVGNYDRALADFNDAVRHDPLDAKAFAGRGQVWEHKGDKEQAKSDYRMAIAAPAIKPADKKARETARDRLQVLEKAAMSPSPAESARPSTSTAASSAQPFREPPRKPNECPKRTEDLETQFNDFLRWVDRINVDEYAQLRTSSPDPCKIDKGRLLKLQTEIQQQSSALSNDQMGFYSSCTRQEMTKIVDEIKKREPLVDRQNHTVTIPRTSILHGRLEKLSNIQVQADKKSESIIKISSRMKNLSDWARDVVRDCTF